VLDDDQFKGYQKYNDGTAIPDETANTAGWGGLATGARSDYTGEASYIATYGYLYNWYAAVGIVTNLGSPTKTSAPQAGTFQQMEIGHH
jgi:hypothetical protein